MFSFHEEEDENLLRTNNSSDDDGSECCSLVSETEDNYAAECLKVVSVFRCRGLCFVLCEKQTSTMFPAVLRCVFSGDCRVQLV